MGTMTDDTAQTHTLVDLRALDDAAAAQRVGSGMEARFARAPLGCERTGVSLQKLAPGAKQPFAHRHGEDEEIYVTVSGSGRALVDGEPVELTPMTALRVAPSAVRTFEAGDEGLEFLAFGSHTDGDGEIVRDGG